MEHSSAQYEERRAQLRSQNRASLANEESCVKMRLECGPIAQLTREADVVSRAFGARTRRARKLTLCSSSSISLRLDLLDNLCPFVTRVLSSPAPLIQVQLCQQRALHGHRSTRPPTSLTLASRRVNHSYDISDSSLTSASSSWAPSRTCSSRNTKRSRRNRQLSYRSHCGLWLLSRRPGRRDPPVRARHPSAPM